MAKATAPAHELWWALLVERLKQRRFRISSEHAGVFLFVVETGEGTIERFLDVRRNDVVTGDGRPLRPVLATIRTTDRKLERLMFEGSTDSDVFAGSEGIELFLRLLKATKEALPAGSALSMRSGA